MGAPNRAGLTDPGCLNGASASSTARTSTFPWRCGVAHPVAPDANDQLIMNKRWGRRPVARVPR